MLIIGLWLFGIVVAQMDIVMSPTIVPFNVTEGGEQWFLSEPPFFYNGVTRVVVGENGVMTNIVKGDKGVDVLGPYTLYGFTLIDSQDNVTTMDCRIKIYQRERAVFAIIFEQSFPSGIPSLAVNNVNLVSTGFPVLSVINPVILDRGWMRIAGGQAGSQDEGLGLWSRATQLSGGLLGGPITLFSMDLSQTIVISSYSNFMVNSWTMPKAGQIEFGLLGSVKKVNPGFTLSTIFHWSSNGIRQGILEWGDSLRKTYKRINNREEDITLNYLGYSTDNGAYYYYLTEPGKNYEDTLIDVADALRADNIPVRYWLLDSWWYFKGKANGVTKWEARPDIFPSGLGYLYNRTNLLVQAHNRYWEKTNVYAKQNGGDYSFYIENNGAVPLEQKFWDDFLSQRQSWGLRVYEQDWLNVELTRVDLLRTDTDAARNWLLQMDRGANKNALSIQYCMANPRHLLQSLETRTVTQARATDDYRPGNDQWKIGHTAPYLQALGIAPSKDGFWTSEVETGNKYHSKEPYWRLQVAAATLSTGPVAFADEIGKWDRKMIMKSCRADGLLMQPDTPSTLLDTFYVQRIWGYLGTKTYFAMATTTLGSGRYGYLTAVQLSQPLYLNLQELGYDSETVLVAFEANTTNTIVMVNSTSDLKLRANPIEYDFFLYYLAPVLGNGIAFQGEVSKWAPFSTSRFSAIQYEENSPWIWITMDGEPGESVQVGCVDLQLKQHLIATTIPDSGTTTVRCPSAQDSKRKVF
jgi:hypothetical protein